MSPIDLDDVMDELGSLLRRVPGLNVYDEPPDSVAVPAAVVGLPDSLRFDGGYGGRLDRMDIPVVLLVQRSSSQAARQTLTPYCARTGGRSVKAVLEAQNYHCFDTLRVAGWEFDVVTVGTTDYRAAVGTVEITG